MVPHTATVQSSLPLPAITDPSILDVRNTVNQIRLLANQLLILFSKSSLNDEEATQLANAQRKLQTLKIMLRGFNREVYLQNRAVKQATSESKVEVEGLYLGLQNLKYEQQHLRSEIQDCKNYMYFPIS
jgi:Fms-interacting protein/Thoc5